MLETSESTGGNFAAGGAEHRNLKSHRSKGFKSRYENIGTCNIIIQASQTTAKFKQGIICGEFSW